MKILPKRISKSWFSGFSANLLGVVIGIAVTFIVSDWISARSEKKSLQRSLELVKMELEDNLPMVQELYEYYKLGKDFSDYLLTTGNQENLQADSLRKYEYVVRSLKIMNYQSSAYEMLKSSGSMRLIQNKVFLKSIIESYSTMEYARKALDIEMERKLNEVFDVATRNGIEFDLLPLLQNPENIRLFNYFSIYTAAEGNFRECEQKIEETLELFQKN